MIKTIFIGNVLEGYYKSYLGLPEKEKNFWLTYDRLDSNRTLLYGDDDKAIVTYIPILQKNFSKLCQIMNWKNVHNIYPQNASYSICEDCINDHELKNTLITLIEKNPEVAIVPYRSTQEFQKLIAYLRSKKLVFTTPETIPTTEEFAANYFHSKRGFRHLWHLANHKNNHTIAIPEGFITCNRDEAVEAAWWFKTQGSSFVIKYNKGTQGIGLFIVDHQNYPHDKAKFIKKLNELLKDKIWDEPTIIVERLIKSKRTDKVTSPSIEFYIDKNGQVKKTYACDQILGEDKKTFRGIYIYPEINKNRLINRAFVSGEYLGKKLSEYGYRGVFDIDLIKIGNDKIYAVESNMRRTGGTHIHEACQALLGKKYWKKYHIINEDLTIKPGKKLTYEYCQKMFFSMLYDSKKKYGLLFFNPDMLVVNILNVTLIASSEAEIFKLQKKIREKLQAFMV